MRAAGQQGARTASRVFALQGAKGRNQSKSLPAEIPGACTVLQQGPEAL